jgi:hypothetical protein
MEGDQVLWVKRRSSSRSGRVDATPRELLGELEQTLGLISAGEAPAAGEEAANGEPADGEPGFDPVAHALSLTRAAATGVARYERQAEQLAGSLRKETRRQVAGLRADLARVTSEANSSAGAVERLSQQLAEAHATLAELDGTVAILRARGEQLEDLLAAERDASERHALEFDQLAVRVEEAERSTQLAQAALEDQRQELERAQGRILSLTAALPRSPLHDDLEPGATVATDDTEASDTGPLLPGGGVLPPETHEAPQCSVCYRLPDDTTRDELKSEGWTLSNGTWLCPECERRGWRLPPTRRLHRFRLGGT